MKYRPFGKTNWLVSEIALGTMPLSGMYNEVSDETAIQTMLYAFEKGINFVDTALMYGEGRSHHQVARALQEWDGDKIYVATKVQPIQWPHPFEDSPPMRARYPDWYLREEIERALIDLKVDCLDLLQLHCWCPAGITELDWLETLFSLQREGKIDQIGVSIRDHRPEDGLELAKLGLVSSQQVVFNLFDQRPSDKLFDIGKETGTAFLARVPFDCGSLTGSWTESTYASFRADSIQHKYFQGWRFDETLKRVQALEKVIAPYYESLAEAAMRYSLSHPAVSAVIPGMVSRQEIDINVAYSDGAAFPDTVIQKLKSHSWPRNFYAPDRTES